MPSYVITTPDGQKFKITADTDEQANAAVNDLLGQIKPAEKTETGFATRENREADMPETPKVARERRIAQRMARGRENFGADDVFLQNYTFGLRDEAAGAGAGVASLLQGHGFSTGYEESKEADRRLREEYAQKNPGKNAAASIGGLVTGGLGKAAGTAVSAPTSLLGQVKEGAKIGATQGAVYGAAEGDETEDGRLWGAVKGGAIGGATGAIAPVVVEGVKAAARPLTNTVRAALNPEQEAARRVATARADDLAKGQGLDDAAYDAARAAGQPVTLMERGGEKTRALARSAANQSPEARAAMEEVVRPRFATQVERLDDVVRGESKLAMSADDFMDAAEAAARKANAPAYRKAMNLGADGIWDDTLQQLVDAPAMQRAIKGAISKSADNAVIDGFGAMNPKVSVDDFGNLVFRDKGGMPAYPDLRLWDLTKRELDRMGKMAARSGDSDARIYQTLAKKLTEHLDGLGEMGKAYKAARQTAASFFGAQNAYEAGGKFASQKGMSAREAIKGMSKLKPDERELFKEGYIQALRDQLGELKTNRDATLAIMNSKADVERARIALGKAGAERLQAQLEIETTMDAVRKAFGNSTTARQLTELGLASAAGSGSMAATGNTDPTSLTVGALAGAATRWGRGKIDARLAEQIGKMLASNDPKKVEALVKMASRSPKYLEAIRAIRAHLVSTGAIATTEAVSP